MKLSLLILAALLTGCGELHQYDSTHERIYTGSYSGDTNTAYVGVTIIPKGFNK